MKLPLLAVLVCSTLMSIVTVLSAQTIPTTKKLIEFGWDEPDNVFLRQHIAGMEKTPFDGTVFHVLYTNKDGSSGVFMNDCWGKRMLTEAELAKAREALVATPIKKFTHNFLRFNVQPGDVDWF